MTDTSVPVEKKHIDVKTRLGTIPFNIDAHEHAHITIDQDICVTCPDHMCMYACPAECFFEAEKEMTMPSRKPEAGGRMPGAAREKRRVVVMHFRYEDCVECGTCDTMCTHGSVKWNNPRGGFGVRYQYG